MQDLAYQLKRSKRIAAIKIEIKSNGQILVTAPPLIPNFLIKNFVQQQRPWIDKNLAKAKKNQAGLELNETFLFGKKYAIEFRQNQKKLGVEISEQKILINQLDAKTSKKQSQAQLERFFKNTATKYLSQKTKILAEKMAIDYQRIGIKQQKSRWGSCSSRGNLNFNWRLVHYPPAVIDYVIIHELAHRRQLNHSQKFWQLVAEFDPHYKIHKTQLKKRLYND